MKQNNSHGSAGWATRADLSGLIVPASGRAVAGGLIVGPSPFESIWRTAERIELPRELAHGHVMILGPPSSGKGRGFFLWQCAHYQGSFLYADPKSEGWQLTSGYRSNPVRYAPMEPERSECFNWIPLCGKDSLLTLLIANAIVTSGEDGKGHPFFTRADTAFLASLFAHASTFENATPAAAYDFLTTHPGKLLTQALLESPNRVAREFAVIFSQSEAKLRGSIIMGVATQLMWLRDERIRRFTSSSLRAADFGSLRTAEASIYWCLSESDVAVLKPLSTLFFTLALYQVKRAEGAVAVNFLLDELANIGQIPNLDVEVAILRGRGVGLTIGLQSVSQLEQMYGRAAAKVIMDCINTTVVRRGLDADSAEHISRALGEQTHVEQKRSSTKKAWAFFDMPNETKSEAKHARAVLTADEVRRIGNQEQLMITTNRRPVRMNGWWWTTEKCEATAGACGEVLTERFSVEKGSELSAGLDDEPMMPESLKAKVGAEVG